MVIAMLAPLEKRESHHNFTHHAHTLLGSITSMSIGLRSLWIFDDERLKNFKKAIHKAINRYKIRSKVAVVCM